MSLWLSPYITDFLSLDELLDDSDDSLFILTQHNPFLL